MIFMVLLLFEVEELMIPESAKLDFHNLQNIRIELHSPFF